MEFDVVDRLLPLRQFLFGKRSGVNAVCAHIGIFHGGFGGLVESHRVGTFAEFHEIVVTPFAPVVQTLLADVVAHIERGRVAVGGHILVDSDDDGVFHRNAAPVLLAQLGHVAHLHAEALGRRFRDGVGDAVDPVVPVASHEFEAEHIPASLAEGPDFHLHLLVVFKDNVGGRAILAHIGAATSLHVGRGRNDGFGNRAAYPRRGTIVGKLVADHHAIDAVAVLECLVVGEVVTHLHEDDIERGEGCRQAEDVEDGRRQDGFSFFEYSCHKSVVLFVFFSISGLRTPPPFGHPLKRGTAYRTQVLRRFARPPLKVGGRGNSKNSQLTVARAPLPRSYHRRG